MTIHNLFWGGQRTNNPEWAMLPQVEPGPKDPMDPDARGTPVWFSLTRRLTFKHTCTSCGGCQDPCSPNENPCTCAGPTRRLDGGSQALRRYIENNPIVEGDIINAVILPQTSALAYVWYKVANPVDGLTFDIRVRGNSTSVGGTTAVPVPIVIASDIDGSVASEGLLCAPAFAGCHPYFDCNDMLQIVVKTLPVVSNDCDDCGCCDPCAGIKSLSLIVSPVVLFPCRGFN